MADTAREIMSLDEYFQTTPIGSIDRAIGNNLYGYNHRQTPGMVPMNKDSYGLTFFVRPQLNLQSDNIRNNRLFYPLLSKNPASIERFVRTTLDPRLVYGYGRGVGAVLPIDCPVMDNQQAFIPVLTNNLNSISGWPDATSAPFISKPGLYKEVYSQVDDIAVNYEAFTIDASFRNTKGDPIVYMFYLWYRYQALVFEGMLMPYPDFIIENELDYNTRIYRLVLDSEKRYVTKIAACGVAFPISVPTGQFFDYSNEKPYNDQSKDITIRLQCLGGIYYDNILIKEFNDTVCIFNPSMSDKLRGSSMVKVHPSFLPYFNNRGYPRIEPNNYELQWYVPEGIFRTVTDSIMGLQTGSDISKASIKA